MSVGAVVTSANWVALVLVLKSHIVNCDVYTSILPASATLWEWPVRLWEVPTSVKDNSSDHIMPMFPVA
jgi:hypothetical protein